MECEKDTGENQNPCLCGGGFFMARSVIGEAWWTYSVRTLLARRGLPSCSPSLWRRSHWPGNGSPCPQTAQLGALNKEVKRKTLDHVAVRKMHCTLYTIKTHSHTGSCSTKPWHFSPPNKTDLLRRSRTWYRLGGRRSCAPAYWRLWTSAWRGRWHRSPGTTHCLLASTPEAHEQRHTFLYHITLTFH